MELKLLLSFNLLTIRMQVMLFLRDLIMDIHLLLMWIMQLQMDLDISPLYFQIVRHSTYIHNTLIYMI